MPMRGQKIGLRRKINKKLKEQSTQRSIPPEAVARIYDALGDRQQALDLLEKSCENRGRYDGLAQL